MSHIPEKYELRSQPGIVLALGSMSLPNVMALQNELVTQMEQLTQDITAVEAAVQQKLGQQAVQAAVDAGLAMPIQSACMKLLPNGQ